MIDFEEDQTAVRQQGDRETCVGFAVSAGHEWVADDAHVRSPEDAMWAGHQLMGAHVGEATSVRFALQGLVANEHASEVAWPYGSPEWSAGRPPEALNGANRRALPAWRRLSAPTVAAIRQELSVPHAAILTIGVVRQAWLSSSGIVDAGPGGKVAGNHAVLVVGVSEQGENPQQVKIKNSWGERWGSSGYALLSARYLDGYAVCAHAIERST